MPYKDDEVRKRKDREYKHKRIQYAKDNNLCIQCRKPLKEDRLGKTLCKECSDKRCVQQKATREFCKSIGICPRCNKNRIFGDEKSCVECKAKNAEYKQKLRESNREKSREYRNKWQKERYQKLKEEGICTRCAKRQALEGKCMCSICSAKNNKRRERTTNGRDRVANGLCYWCGKPVKEGYKVCEKHYQANLIKLNHPKVIEARQVVKDIEHQKYLRWEKANIG